LTQDAITAANAAAAAAVWLQVAASSLWAMMTDPAHPLQPYFASLPKRDELLCPLIQLQKQHWNLLQNAYVVSHSDPEVASFASLPKRDELLCPLTQLQQQHWNLLQNEYVVSMGHVVWVLPGPVGCCVKVVGNELLCL
jgi:hypothetical protein